MPDVDLICLANSRKRGGRCVAGLRVDGGGWVRPVSDTPEGTLTRWRLSDGSDAALLDVIRFDLAGGRARPHQPENWLLGRRPWRLVARPAGPSLAPALLTRLVEGPELLGSRSDRLTERELRTLPHPASLALVEPRDLRWHIRTGGSVGWQTRVEFTLAGQPYSLSLTDPAWERRLVHLQPGAYPVEAAGIQPGQRVLLTISLGEPWQGAYYKLAAAVIVLPESWG